MLGNRRSKREENENKNKTDRKEHIDRRGIAISVG